MKINTINPEIPQMDEKFGEFKLGSVNILFAHPGMQLNLFCLQWSKILNKANTAKIYHYYAKHEDLQILDDDLKKLLNDKKRNYTNWSVVKKEINFKEYYISRPDGLIDSINELDNAAPLIIFIHSYSFVWFTRESDIRELVFKLKMTKNIIFFLVCDAVIEIELRGGDKKPGLCDLRCDPFTMKYANKIILLNRPEYHGIIGIDGEEFCGKAFLTLIKCELRTLNEIEIKYNTTYQIYEI